MIWALSKESMAPHAVTFLNGAKEPKTLVGISPPNCQEVMTFGPDIVTPSKTNQSMTNQGVNYSGIIVPGVSAHRAFSLKVGNFTGNLGYICILYEESSMKGTLVPIPRPDLESFRP
jgi:hypothetical protein